MTDMAERSGRSVQEASLSSRVAIVQVVMSGLTLALIFGGVRSAMEISGGTFHYSLDDPYIHLAVAEEILKGNYGINPGDAAAPSSSILWPWLLAAGLAVGLGTWGPLAATTAAAIAVAWLGAGYLCRAVDPQRGTMVVAAIALSPLCILALGLPSLALSGMENIAHVLASLLIVGGLIRLGETGAASGWLIAGIVLAPLLRFEGFAFAALAIGTLALHRHWGAAAIASGLLSAAVGAYALYMWSLGLPFVPSSVAMKSEVVSGGGPGGIAGWMAATLRGVIDTLTRTNGVALVSVLAVLLLSLAGAAHRPGLRTVALPVAGAITAHLVLGEIDHWQRYDAYAFAIGLAALAWVLGPRLARPQVPLWAWFGGLSALLLTRAVSLGMLAIVSPLASQNIWLQQYQMHRFVTDIFPHPVAVNDLGWVSFRNENHVLDLRGLGSEEVRRLRTDGAFTAERVAALTDEVGTVAAMVYDDWFTSADGVSDLPAAWCRIAQLRTPVISASGPVVAIYLVDPTMEGEMRDALGAFGATLPPPATLATAPCDGS